MDDRLPSKLLEKLAIWTPIVKESKRKFRKKKRQKIARYFLTGKTIRLKSKVQKTRRHG